MAEKTPEEIKAIADKKAAEAKAIAEKEAKDKAAADKKAAEEAAKDAAEEKEETVTISKDQFDLILGKIADLQKGQQDLEKTASPDQIKKIEALRASGKLVKSVKISMIDGKLVSSWESTADEVYIDHVLGKEVSKQMTKITFFDGKSKEISQSEFSKRKVYSSFEVIKEGKNKEGDILLTVATDDGKELEIDSRYIN